MGRTVTITVASRDEVTDRVKRAFRGEKQEARISFASTTLLLKVLTSNRLAMLQCLAGQPPMATREIARRLGRDVHAVHNDVHALLNAGVLQRDGEAVSFPFDTVRLDVTLTGTDPVTPPPRRRRREQQAA